MTPSQERLFKYAVGDGSTWPKITDDPEVNYEVDRFIAVVRHQDTAPWPPWVRTTEKVKQAYGKEVDILKRSKVRGVLLIFRFDQGGKS